MKIAINGFGRIGRNVLRVMLFRKMNVVAINDVHGIESAEYLFKHDSVYGTYKGKIERAGKELIIDGRRIKILSERNPLKIDWKKLGVDVVVESTGAFTKGKDAAQHLKAGAEKVIITAPAESPDVTIVPGVNSSMLKKTHKIISVGSCTTNCTATVAKVLLDELGINWAMLTTVHAYTNDQIVHDSYHESMRRGRAAGLNIIPTTTGAAEAVLEVLPQLRGRMTGLSVRVPVACGSLIDLTAEVRKKTSVREVNKIMERASRGVMKNFLSYSEEQLVSSDIIGNTHSAIVDSLSTQVTGNLVKVLAWYDNEFGSSNRFVDAVQMLK